ncbi:MAG: NAD(P)H-dependent oxidoreductase subunit E [Saprospiraceae bacterium]|nr:NAD(P)H-dependent oxidoreductase subunit E [Saprospiraceae bacterium]
MSKNLSHLSGRKELTDNLFEYIGLLAEKDGSLSTEDAAKVAEEFLMGTANVFGTASFYDFTRPENKGKKVYTCNGSACLVAGTQDQVKKNLSQYFNDSEIGEMCCLGRCHENSAFHFDGVNYSGDQSNQFDSIFNGTQKNGVDHYQVKALGQQVLTATPKNLQDILPDLRVLLSKSPEELLVELKTSGLRGRGGAGFPMSFKLDACSKSKGPRKFIVCNADEGDPGSYSDRYLLESQPMLVLIGMWIAGYMTGADRGVVYIRAEYPESIDKINEAVLELRESGILGEGIFGTQFDFEFKVIKAQGAYICGEETALLSSIEGQRPEVRVRPPFPVHEGLFRKPTVVNNVETLANLFYIMTQGGKAYSDIGTAKSTGTKLISLDSGFNHPGIYEVDMGTPLRTAIETLGGGFSRPTKALHIGGPLGGLVPISKIDELTLDFEGFAQAGFMLGHASIVSIPESYPMIEYLEHLFAFTAHESCGKCFPCRLGSTRGKELIQKAQQDIQYKIDIQLMNDLLDTMKRGSLCALGGGIPLPVYNALQYFKDELAPYFK